MCGFLGYVGDVAADRFRSALDELAGRGPDAVGLWAGRGVRLGHRRLSVIDLEGGIQPMSTPCGRYHLAYNGEIYNFPEVRRRLEGRGVRFETRSDTEVLLHVLVEWGPDALVDLDGMFAFALWDDRERTLLLARDRIGIKPVFHARVPGGFVVGSTLAPFWRLPEVSKRLRWGAVRDYLAQEFIGTPDTIVRDVHGVEPGTWLRYHDADGRIETGRFWDIPEPTDEPLSVDDLTERTDAALRESVRRQLVADVPLGVLFSGGIDSSLMLHYAREAAGRPIRTFTVKFEQSAEHDEAPIAKTVAEQLGSEHHEYRAGRITEDEFRTCVATMDQPFGDASYLPVRMLSRFAREHVTVALGGDGGDELFGGYDRYLKEARRYPDRLGMGLLRRACERRLLPSSLYRSVLTGRRRVTRHFSRMGHYPVTTRGLSTIVTDDALPRLDLERTMSRWLASVGEMKRDDLMRPDLWYYLAQNCLVKTDRASMSFGLEARVPMLGNPVLDLVVPQPADVKLAEGTKTVLNRLARRYLPREVWDRRKRGFTVPVYDYLCDRWRGYCESLVADCDRIAPFLDAGEITSRWNDHRSGRHADWPLYAVIVLLGWLDSHPVELA